MTGHKLNDDSAMLALMHPFARGLLATPQGKTLLVNPAPVTDYPAFESVDIWQWWKGLADVLSAQGETLPPEGPPPEPLYDAALVRLPRQREEAQFVMAAAFDSLKAGGIFVAAGGNDSGGGRLESDLAEYWPALNTASKHKSRIVWAEKKAGMTLPQFWRDAGALQKHPVTGFWSRPGLFSWDRIDGATAMLLPYLPQGRDGVMADLGCGYGVITDHILRTNPDIKNAICMDADARALEAAKKSLAEIHPGRAVEYRWSDLSIDIKAAPVDLVVMNPPFHAEKALAIDTGQSFITNAAALLKQNGDLFMVANAHLPYEQILRHSFRNVEKRHEGKGFKIFHAQK